jgi:hypothetical protein
VSRDRPGDAYDWRQRDETFAHAWEDALERSTRLLEDHARARALAGPDDPGAATLLIFLLKARRREVYRDRVEVRHTDRVELVVHLEALRRAAEPDPEAAERMAMALAAAERVEAAADRDDLAGDERRRKASRMSEGRIALGQANCGG